MATGNTRDVQLIVRARTEGERLIDSLRDALVELGGAQAALADGAPREASKIQQLAGAYQAVAAAMPKLEENASRAGAAFDRQETALAATAARLAQVKGEIEAASKVVANHPTKIVDVKLDGGDTSRLVAELAAAQSMLPKLVAEQQRLRDAIAKQESALDGVRGKYQQVASAATAADQALKVAADIPAQAAALEQEAVAAEAVGKFVRGLGQAWESAAAQAAKYRAEAQAARSQVAVNTLTGVGAQAATLNGATFSALDEQARAADAVGRAFREVGLAEQLAADKAAALRARMDPLGAIEARLNIELAEANKLRRAGVISADELAAAEVHLRQEAKNAADQLDRVGKGASGKPALFGLKPYELQNLNYQINDVVTGLASGQRPMQIIAQQGGQILQLFPKMGSALVGALSHPAILAAAAALGVVAAAIARAEAEAQRLRGFEGLLHSIGDNAAYTAGNLADSAREIQHMGVAADDANAAVTRFVHDGVDPSRLLEFGRAARDLSDVLNIDMSDAANQVGAAFTGNYDAILRLQEATQFLTAAELVQIRTLFDEGRAAEARNRALELFRTRMDQAAQQARGPWAQAGRDLRRIWDDVIGAVAQSPQIQSMILGLNQLADALDRVAGAGGNVAANPPARLSAAAVQSRLNQLERNLNMVQSLLAVHPNDRQLQAWKADVERRIANLRTSGAETGDPRSPQSNAAQQEALDIARTHAQQMSLIELQRRYDELTEADRRYGDTVNANQRIAIQGQIAFNNTLNDTHNRQRALNSQLEAEARERARIAAEQRQGAEANISRFARRVMTAESGGRNDAANPRSTAFGQGQFIESTWLNLFRRYFPGEAARMGTQAILELRRNQEVSRHLIELYARENAETLQRAGQAVTQFNLYLAHYLGGTGAANVLRAAPGTPIVQAISGGAAPGSRADRDARRAVAANAELRNGGTAGGALAAIHRRVDRTFGSSGPGADDEQAVLEQINQLEAQRAVQQDALNRRIDQENAERERTTAQARALLGLSGDQLTHTQRQQAIDDAVAQAQQEAARQQLTVDDARLQRIRDTVGAEWDVVHAREAATRAVDEATGERSALLERLQQAQQQGDTSTVAQLTHELDEVDQRLNIGIEKALTYWRGFNNPEARAAIHGLLQLRDGLHRTEEEMARAPESQHADRLQAIRQELQTQIDFFQNQGMTAVAEQLRGQLHAIDTELISTIDHLIDFWSHSTDPQGPQMVLQFQNLRNQIVATQNQFRIAAGDIQQAFSTDLTNAVMQWAQALGEGGNVLRSTWAAARSFAASFIRDLGEMLLKALVLKAAMKIGFGNVAGGMNSLLNVAPLVAAGGLLHSAGTSLTTSGGTLIAAGGIWEAVASQLQAAATTLLIANAASSAAVFHGGGIAGSGGTVRSVFPGVFAAARRFHRGGLPGLAADEIPTILQRGEEVLTRSNPRHIFNGGGMGGPGGEPKVDIKNVVVFDPADVLSKGLASRVGEKVLLNWVRQNAEVVKAALN